MSTTDYVLNAETGLIGVALTQPECPLLIERGVLEITNVREFCSDTEPKEDDHGLIQ